MIVNSLPTCCYINDNLFSEGVSDSALKKYFFAFDYYYIHQGYIITTQGISISPKEQQKQQ